LLPYITVHHSGLYFLASKCRRKKDFEPGKMLLKCKIMKIIVGLA
jgi:hypothetical protein